MMRELICPDRLRTLEKPFAWLPCRFLRDGYLAQLSQPAKLLYLLLSLAANSRGLSFFGDRRIGEELALTSSEIAQAREELIASQFLAFDGATYQLLSLPVARQPQHTPANQSTFATQSAFEHQMPEEVRQVLRHILSSK